MKSRVAWVFASSAMGWLGLVALTTSWPRLGPALGLPGVFPSDVGGALVLVLLIGTVVGGLGLAGGRPEEPESPADAPAAVSLLVVEEVAAPQPAPDARLAPSPPHPA